MRKQFYYFSRVLCALLLCVGIVVTSCEETNPVDNNKTEQGGNEDKCPATLTLGSVTATTATFTGHLDVPASDLSFSQVTVYYSDAETFNMNSAQSVSATSFDNQQNFTITITNLKYKTKYNYCMVAEVKSEKTYGDVLEFTTLKHPYELSYDLDVASATDLSSSGSANCYIISESGLYKFKPVKGNSNESVGNIASASLLWESFGTSIVPEPLDLISAFGYKGGYIVFQTADTFKEGNAVIAAKDADGNILWSWHIWFTDQPHGQEYYNNAGTMMDRNLGAISATPGDVGALGLLYQWGRKDPFPGSASISEDIISAATGTWTTSELKDINSTEMNPMVISTNLSNFPDDAWSSTKTAYDPCPYGWRVPNGDYDGPWYIAGFEFTGFDEVNKGISLDLGNGTSTWYPAIGRRYEAVIGAVGTIGYYWTSTSDSNARYSFGFYQSGISLWGYSSKSIEARGIRCQKETANNNSSKTSGNQGVNVNNGNGVWEPVK